MSAEREDWTIFAPATAAGRAGIAIMRLSGPRVRAALDALSIPVPPPRRAVRTRFRDPTTGESIDDGLVIFFPGPASLTGEDVAELQLHGSRAVMDAMVAVLAAQPGLRPAGPGEFTRRAFEHGKLDLTAAEAVADLVAAETAAQRRQALRQLEGELGRLYEGWARRLLRALAHLEAEIDFPEEGLPQGIAGSVLDEVNSLGAEIAGHLADNRRGEAVREGVSIAILGPPNAGKSSLLNALARREAAITSEIAGTTRDVIEVRLDLAGYPVILADTAGLRAARDAIEAEGVRRALERGAAAELVLMVFDVGRPEELAELPHLGAETVIAVANKIDLLADRGRGLPVGTLGISALTGEGVAALLERLAGEVEQRYAPSGGAALTRGRHRQALETCREALERAREAPLPEMAAEDLRLGLRALGGITGRVDVESLLDVIFSEFCIGK
jgi:tRNA modification GTPase